jgi:hypothetical protein
VVAPDAQTTAIMAAAFEEVCADLGLAAREDALRDLVALEVKKCVEHGERDVARIRACVRETLSVEWPGSTKAGPRSSHV